MSMSVPMIAAMKLTAHHCTTQPARLLSMLTAFQLRTWHKWLGLVLGLQVAVWCVSGLYMVSFDIDFIRGLPLVRKPEVKLPADARLIPFGEMARRYEEVTAATLHLLPDSDRPVYELNTRARRVLVDAVSGAQLSPLPQARIEALARLYYAGAGEIERVELLESAPVEIRGREPPVWRIDFDDALAASFYLDPDTGALVTRRHRYWRLFDAFWMLHIMDYGYERDDMNNLLLRLASAAGVVFGGTGLWLLFFSFRRRVRR
jgi:uncharacterized iron-regulated membrane protein